MSKQEFLYRLETLLMDLPKDEREDALDYYEQYFEAAGPDREEEVLRELGSPEKVSEMIHSGGGQEQSGRRAYERPMAPSRPRKSHAPLWIALGVIGAVFVLMLVIGVLNFAAMRTTRTVAYSTGTAENRNNSGLGSQIGGFVDGIINEVMDEVGSSLEDGLDAALNDNVFENIQQSVEEELGKATAGKEGWDGMQDDYAEGAITVQPEGSVVLAERTPLAWKEVREICVNLPSAAVLFREVSGETLQVESKEGNRIRVQFENGTLTLENTEEAAREDDTVIVFVPEDMELDSLKVSSDSGYFESENLQVETLHVDLPDGVWKNSGTISAGTVTFEMSDGYLAAGVMNAAESLNITLADGVISADRLDSPEISMECRDGIIRATLAGAQEDYRWEASVGDGFLEIGDYKSWSSLENDQGEKNLAISVNDGAAKLAFEA